MKIETEHLNIRPWTLEDASDLYTYTSDRRVGEGAGWPTPKDLEECKYIIQELLTCWGFFALEHKETKQVIGCITILVGDASNYDIDQNDGELTFWLGVPFWGKGLMKEAIEAMCEYAFDDLELDRLWCGHAENNQQSKRLQEKCSFHYHHTLENVKNMIGEAHREIVTRLTYEEWYEM